MNTAKALISEFRKYWQYKPIRTMFWVRFLGYFIIYITPFWGMLLAIYLDAWDWDYLQKYNINKAWYHRVDKVVDFLEYLVILPLVIVTPIGGWYLAFLLWRAVGMILYFFINIKTTLFVLFPNVAEYLALAYITSETFSLNWNVISLPWLVGLLCFKLIVELQLHYFQFLLPIKEGPQPKILRAFSKFNQSLIP